MTWCILTASTYIGKRSCPSRSPTAMPSGGGARGRKRDPRRMVVAAVEDRAAAGRGARRRRRRARSAAHGPALDTRAALPVPRVHEHHRTDRPQTASRGRQEPEEGRRRPVARPGRRSRGGMAGIVQPAGTGPQGVPRPEKPPGRRHRRRPTPASRQGAPNNPQTHPRGTPVHVRRTAGGMRDADPANEQPHRVMERTHPRHATPAPGLSLVRQIKAVCWWCHQHTGHPEPDAWLAANAVTDEQIETPYREAWEHSPLGAWQTTGIPMRYSTGTDWDEFHTPTEYYGTPD